MRQAVRATVNTFPMTFTQRSDIAADFMHVSALAQSKCYSQGLKPSQWTALRYFAMASVQRATVSAFAAYLGATRGAASQMVEILVVKGLLLRGTAPDDRRVVRLSLTERATELMAQDPLRDFARAIAALPAEQQSVLADVLGRLQQELRQPSGGVRNSTTSTTLEDDHA